MQFSASCHDWRAVHRLQERVSYAAYPRPADRKGLHHQ